MIQGTQDIEQLQKQYFQLQKRSQQCFNDLFDMRTYQSKQFSVESIQISEGDNPHDNSSQQQKIKMNDIIKALKERQNRNKNFRIDMEKIFQKIKVLINSRAKNSLDLKTQIQNLKTQLQKLNKQLDMKNNQIQKFKTQLKNQVQENISFVDIKKWQDKLNQIKLNISISSEQRIQNIFKYLEMNQQAIRFILQRKQLNEHKILKQRNIQIQSLNLDNHKIFLQNISKILTLHNMKSSIIQQFGYLPPLRQSIKTLQNDLKQQMKTLQKNLKQQIQTLQKKINQQIQNLKKTIKNHIQTQKKNNIKINQLQQKQKELQDQILNKSFFQTKCKQLSSVLSDSSINQIQKVQNIYKKLNIQSHNQNNLNIAKQYFKKQSTLGLTNQINDSFKKIQIQYQLNLQQQKRNIKQKFQKQYNQKKQIDSNIMSVIVSQFVQTLKNIRKSIFNKIFKIQIIKQQQQPFSQSLKINMDLKKKVHLYCQHHIQSIQKKIDKVHAQYKSDTIYKILSKNRT